MFLLIDFEGFTNRSTINKKLGLDIFSYPCVLSYVIVKDLTKLEGCCKKIKTKWFPITKNIDKIIEGFFRNLLSRGKVKYIIFHGSYEYSVLNHMGLKAQLIDLDSILSTKLSLEPTLCYFDSRIKDGKTAHFMLTKYFKTGNISKELKSDLENYNKMDVASLISRFKKLLFRNLETKRHEDKMNFIVLQKKLKLEYQEKYKLENSDILEDEIITPNSKKDSKVNSQNNKLESKTHIQATKVKQHIQGPKIKN